MFTKKNFKEVFESIKQHKTRNYLTGFGVSWGILVLLVMLGAGEAFRVGIGSQFGGFAQNSINFIGGQTSKANVGESVGRRIFFSEQLVYKLKERFSNELADISPVVFYQKRQNVFFGKNFSSPRITGVLDEFYNIRHFDIVAGRVLNPLDIAKKRKVIVINEVIKDELFDKGINPIGKSINIAGNWYRVIGVVKSDSMINQAYTRSLFMPYGTMKKYLRHGYRIGSILVGIADGEDALKAEKKIVKYLAKNLRFSINDKKAVTVQNLHQQMKQFDGLFTGMKVFVWFFGLCILLTAE